MKHLKRIIVPLLLFIVAVAYQFNPGILSIDSGSIQNALHKTSVITIIFSVTWMLVIGVKVFKKFLLSRYDIHQKDNLQSRKVYTQVTLLERIVIFIIIIIGVGLILLTFEDLRRIGLSLFASAGVAGIIIGLAAQKIIGTVLAGFQIAITQPIRIDDAVIVENEWGWIEEITLTYVVVRIWDRRRLIVPSTYFIEKPFQNWTRTSADILGTVYLYTDYKVPFEELKKELTRILEGTSLWNREVNVLQVTDSKETTVEIRALMSAKNSSDAWDLRVLVRERMIEFLQKNYPESLPRTRIVLENHENPGRN